MMFNKYMVITSANQCSVRSYRHIGELLRRADVSRCLVRAEGVLDVLDHATATCGVGGKLAFDLTDVDLQSDAEPVTMPLTVDMTDGIALCNDSFAKSCALLVLFAEKGRYDDIDVEAFLAHNNIIGIRYVALFDYAASLSLKPSDLLWLAAANTDPRRDVRLVAEKTLLFDARSKSRDVEGNPRRFPNVVCSSERVIHLVDSRWKEYGLGEFIPSPSLRYRTIKLSDKAEW
jgi:4-hydroxy-3-polyprenylbenzoate decarboxylase